MCILIIDLIPLWRSQLRHLRLRYSRWKAEQGVKTTISNIWCLPIFISLELPSLFCAVVRATTISWTQVYAWGFATGSAVSVDQTSYHFHHHALCSWLPARELLNDTCTATYTKGLVDSARRGHVIKRNWLL